LHPKRSTTNLLSNVADPFPNFAGVKIRKFDLNFRPQSPLTRSSPETRHHIDRKPKTCIKSADDCSKHRDKYLSHLLNVLHRLGTRLSLKNSLSPLARHSHNSYSAKFGLIFLTKFPFDSSSFPKRATYRKSTTYLEAAMTDALTY